MNPREHRADIGHERKPWSERIVLFVVAFTFWLLLVWPVGDDGRWLWFDVAVGAAMAALVAVVMRSMFRQNFIRLLNPRCWFWMVVYLFVFTWYVLRGGFDVVYRVLHPAMPISPGIVRARTTLETDTARSVVANSITLTPGTVTLAVEGNRLRVHALSREAIEYLLSGEMDSRVSRAEGEGAGRQAEQASR